MYRCFVNQLTSMHDAASDLKLWEISINSERIEYHLTKQILDSST